MDEFGKSEIAFTPPQGKLPTTTPPAPVKIRSPTLTFDPDGLLELTALLILIVGSVAESDRVAKPSDSNAIDAMRGRRIFIFGTWMTSF